jgi:hypothetical protein
MNARELQSNVAPRDSAEDGRLAVLEQFRVEDIQHLGRDDLLAAQNLAGHGSEWGRWQTPKSIVPGLKKSYRDINLAGRLRDYLAKEEPTAASVDHLMDQGVLLLTRLALIARLIATGGNGHGKTTRLKPSTIVQQLFQYWPRIVARAIRRKADDPSAAGLLRCLIEADLLEFNGYKPTRIEVNRLDTLVARGVWSDAPPTADIRQMTNPAARPAARPPQAAPEPYPPLPDDWLAEIGPRVLWIVQEMGPNLLRLLEALPQELTDIDWTTYGHMFRKQFALRIQNYLQGHPWRDRAGKPLEPSFRLANPGGPNGARPFEWPPRSISHVINLSVTLQTAHLFITLLASAGRIGEVATLTRGCVEVGRDGKDYLKGFTYKLSGSLYGDERPWPAPPILCECLGQQARLAAAWDWLPNARTDGLPQAPRFGDALWVSIGVSGQTGEDAEVSINQALVKLTMRLDMDPKPGGKSIHAHRFRKTIGRLAGVALFNSPLVLKRLFGHKRIEMTLHYILCDPGVREETEKVLRELRIMHCAEALEEIHEAIRTRQPLPGNGGPGAARLVTAVRNEEKHLEQSGRVWGKGSAYDLAYLLTVQGQGWRLIKENIVCSKVPGEDGLCQKKRSKGEPNTANCQPECGNRIVLMRQRRDTELIIEQYLDIARSAREDGQMLVLAGVMDNLREELESFPDLEVKYLADPEVQSLLALCEEPGEEEAAA